MTYIRSLDGVRAWAILLVIWFHFYFWVESGWIGVQLFFVLSGFLITSILLKAKDQPLGFYLKRFYWRRSWRIFPLYFAYIGFFVAIWLATSEPDEVARSLKYLLTYTYNFEPLFEGRFDDDSVFTPFWSLAVEEQFYLFWPFVVFFANKRAMKVIVALMILGSPVCRFLLAEYLNGNAGFTRHDIGETVYRFTPGQLDAFAFGAAIPVFALTDRGIGTAKKVALGAAALWLGAGALNFASLRSAGESIDWTSFGYQVARLDNAQHVWSYTLIGLAAAGLILFLITFEGNRLTRLLFEHRALVAIGRVSYGMYVYHWVLLTIYRKTLDQQIGSTFVSMLVYLAIVFAVSWLSFEFFEKALLRLKDRRYSLREADAKETVAEAA